MIPFLSLRLMNQHLDLNQFDELMRVLLRHSKVVDEVWLASEYGFPSLERIEQNAEAMVIAAAKLTSQGIKASLQISNSIGHGDYLKFLDFSALSWQRMMGHDGRLCEYVNCPSDPAFLEYMRQATQLYSQFQPYAIWIDDDLRMQHHGPIAYGCFCPQCMHLFNTTHDCSFSRESLWLAINDPDHSEWREKYLDFNVERLVAVTEAIMTGCLATSPNTIGALQHAGTDWSLYNGPSFEPVFRKLRDMTGKPPMSRPGGGFYYDGAPRQMLDKAFSINHQILATPSYVGSIRPEIENLPHAALGKTAQGTCIESTFYLAYGCNALSYATMMLDNDAPHVHENLLAKLGHWKSYWQKLVSLNEGTSVTGLSVPCGQFLAQRPRQPGQKELHWEAPSTRGLPQMMVTGLPIHWSMLPDDRDPFLLYPTLIDGLADAEIEQIVSRGVLMCGESLYRLGQRGFSELIGLRAEHLTETACAEHYFDTAFTRHPDVRPGSGMTIIPTFPEHAGAYRILPLAGQVTEIAAYHAYDGRNLGLSSVLVRKNGNGPVGVIGYHMWEHQINIGRRLMLLRLADAVGSNRLPVQLITAAQVTVLPRVDAVGRLRSVTLVNVSIDQTGPLILETNAQSEVRAILLRPDQADQHMETCGTQLVLPPLGPWSCATVGWY